MDYRPSVFLSASIPERSPFTGRVERNRIRDAVISLVGVCRELGFDLVLGGHPAITPLVHHAAKSLGYDDSVTEQHSEPWNVVIFQALYFRDKFPAEVRQSLDSGHRLFRGTPVVRIERRPQESEEEFQRRERQANIDAMRDEMIDKWPGRYVAGVFVGGMEGILDEFNRFRSHHQQALLLPISSTGGATEMGWPERDVPPLLHQISVDSQQSKQSRQTELLIRDGNEPGFVTYQALFRMLLE